MGKSKGRQRPNWMGGEGDQQDAPQQPSLDTAVQDAQATADTPATDETSGGGEHQQATTVTSRRARGKGPLATEEDEGSTEPGSHTEQGTQHNSDQSASQQQASGNWSPGSGEPGYNVARDYLDSLGAGEEDSPYRNLSGSTNGSAGWAAAASRIPLALGRWAAAHKLVTAVIVALVLGGGYMTFSGGSEPPEPQQTSQDAAQQDTAAAALAGADPADAEESGITFSALEQTEDGEAALATDDLTWEGEVTSGDEGERITLQGPTAAEFERGFNLEHSSIASGVYAVAQPGNPLLHVHTHTFVSDGEEITTGSIYAVSPGSESDQLDYHGFYVDERPDNAEEVVRTYMQPSGESYPVSFSAPRDTPVPLLVGWRGPQGAPAEGEENPEGPTGADPEAGGEGEG